MSLSPNAQALLSLLCRPTVQEDLLRQFLNSSPLTPEELSQVAFDYVEHCFEETLSFPSKTPNGQTLPGYASSHLCQSLQILLTCGLQPNALSAKRNASLLSMLYLAANGYQGADALALLLKHGGDPYLPLPGADESLLHDVSFDVLFDLNNLENRYRYDALVHCWLVLIGFAAETSGAERIYREIGVEACGHFDLAALKHHRKYDFCAIHSDRSEDGMELVIFHRKKRWEVARF